MKCYRWWEYAIRAAAIVIVTMWYGSYFILRRAFGSPPRVTYAIFPRWARAVLWAAGIHVQVTGTEHLKERESYVFIANHASLFDIPVMLVASPIPLRIFYKRQLERVPFLGWALKASTFIAVQREQPQAAGRAVQQAVESLHNDPAALLVFPEGTRSPSGALGHFRRGAFVLASESKRTIAPVAIVGTAQILPAGRLRFCGGTVHVVFLEPVEMPSHQSRHEFHAWMEDIRARIAAVVEYKR